MTWAREARRGEVSTFFNVSPPSTLGGYRSVSEDHDPVRPDRLRGNEAQRPVRSRLAEQPPARAEQGREDHQPQLVDQAALEQRLRESAAAADEQLALEARQLVERHDVRVVPVRVGQRARDDVLRHRVELVREAELVRAAGPGGREALVSNAAEQQRVRVHHLVELEAVALLAALEAERPAAALEALGTARVLEDAVERDELGDDDPAHENPDGVRRRNSSAGLRNDADVRLGRVPLAEDLLRLVVRDGASD